MYAPIIQDLRSSVEQEIVSYLTGFLKLLHDHPENFRPIISGLMGDLSKMLPQTKDGGVDLQNLPPGAVDAMGQFVPRKYRFAYAILKMFMGQGQQETENTGKNPFA